MTSLLFLILTYLLILIVLFGRHSLKKSNKEKRISYFFLKSSLEFLVPLAVVLSFYVGLLAVISRGWQFIGIGSLIHLEEWLTTIGVYMKFKPTSWMVLCLFIVIYLLGVLRLFDPNTRKQLYSGLNTFQKWFKRIYVLFVFLCAFSLLGTQTGKPTRVDSWIKWTLRI